jgi:hypothetical protein
MSDSTTPQDDAAMSPASTGSVGGNKPVAWAVVKIGSPEILFTSEAQSSAMDYIAKKRRPEQWGLVPLIRPPVATPTLTDAEREAIDRARRAFRDMDHNSMTMQQVEDYEALCGLLERMK